MKKYKYIIFDLDDTLLDFRAVERIALEEVFIHYDIDYSQENIQKYRSINDTLWSQLEDGLVSKDEVLYSRFAYFFNEIDLVHDSIEAEAIFRHHLNDGFQTIPYAHDVLENLHNQCYIILAGSNGLTRTQEQRLIKADLLKYFDKVFVSEALNYEKPNPLFFKEIFNQYPDMNQSNVIMIGDTLGSDVRGANNIGIDSIWYNPKKHIQDTIIPTHTISDLREILNLV